MTRKSSKKPNSEPALRRERANLNDLSQGEVVTLAAFLLGGDKRILDTEDIAVKANEIAPGRFAWRKYKEQINLELVRVYLSDSKKKSKGGFVAGSGRAGWSVTSAGRAWVRARGLASLKRSIRLPERNQVGTISPEQSRIRRERTRIQSTSAWRKWLTSQPITRKEALEVFRIDSYANDRVTDLKLGRVRSMFEEDVKLRTFVERLASIVEKRESDRE